MKVRVIFGTESGNAQLAAFDIAERLHPRVDARVDDMADVDVEQLVDGSLLLVVCSTCGDGDLPFNALPFVEALDQRSPDLTGLQVGVFGLGDSSYDNYNRASELIADRLRGLGAQLVGERRLHDATADLDYSEAAVAWAGSIIDALRVA